ncbi:MAG: uroporphyrinogen-III synthase [Deltaproteobacteria bacterium]|nr:uroporphyrinogen-III synthase [Deltaproteobacteria bacterium]
MSSLAGKKILVTRAVAQSEELVSMLESKKAVPLLFPCLEIKFEKLPELDLSAFDWVVFTSNNGIQALSKFRFPEALKMATLKNSTNLSTKWMPNIAPGDSPGEGRETTSFSTEGTSKIDYSTDPSGLYSHVRLADKASSKALAKQFENLPPQKILLPQGNLADDFLKNALEKSGHKVTRITTYRTEIGSGGINLNEYKLDAITFTSPSAARNFLTRLAPLHLVERGWGEVIACIGTTTYKAVQELKFQNIICAKEHSLNGLVQILEEYFS